MIVLAFAFLVGIIIGSFLNVCIARLPAGESVVHPPSHCPRCKSAIKPYDNIPLLSYLLLRGRCRHCGLGIAWRYPGVEALTGVLYVAVVAWLGMSWWTGAALLFVAALVVVTFIDLDHQIIPDEISLPGIVIGFLAFTALGPDPIDSWAAEVLGTISGARWWQALLPFLARAIDSLLGILLGGGTLWLVAALYERLRGIEGMGGGDIKLLAMIGAFLGWRAVLVTVMIGSLSGALVGSVRIWLGRAGSQVPIPFGPFLALGALAALLFGDGLIDWYLGLMAGG
jgi:leader peptidase (prepilin peptidase)/N-methyltransferase